MMMKFIFAQMFVFICFLNLQSLGQRKTILPDKTKFKIAEGEFSFKTFADEHMYEKNKPYSSESNSVAFEEHDNRLPWILHRALEKEKLNDTTKTIFPNYKTSLKMDLEVQRIDTKIIQYYYELKVIVSYRIQLDLKSHFGKSLSARTYNNSFQFFLTNTENLYDEFFDKFENEIGNRMRGFLELDAVKPIIDLAYEVDPTYEISGDSILIKKQEINKINDWNRALVTVIDSLGHGSGAIVSSDGYVVTNYHVIANASKPHVKLHNNRSFPAAIIRYDPETDLALLKIDTTELSTFEIRQNTNNMVGNEVYIAGTPIDTLLSNSITYGVVSGKRAYHGIQYLQTDAVINSGNSGGPMLTPNGQIAGIVNARYAGFGIEGIGFAIPADYVYERLKLKRPAESPTKAPSPPQKKRPK